MGRFPQFSTSSSSTDAQEKPAPSASSTARQRSHRRVWFRHVFASKYFSLPWVGYLAAVCLPLIAVVLTILLFTFWPLLNLQDVLPLLAVLLVAFFWGLGPGLLTTLTSTLLLDATLLFWPKEPTHTLLTLLRPTLRLTIIGLMISIIVSLGRRERLRATRQAQELDTILTTIADGLFVYDKEGHVVHTNPTAQHFNALTSNVDYLKQPYPTRFASLRLQDAQGHPLIGEDIPVTRVLRGEVLTGEQSIDVSFHLEDTQTRLFNTSGAPILDENGEIQGAVMALRDVTERYQQEQRTRMALQALLQFAEALVQSDELPGESRTEEHPEHEIDLVARHLAALISQVLGYRIVCITTFHDSSETPAATAAYGLTPEQERVWSARQAGATLSGSLVDTPESRALQANEMVVLDLSQPRFASAAALYGPSTCLLVPMYLKERMVGILTLVANDGAYAYSADEQSLARALAQLVILTLERAQLFQERMQEQAAVLALRETNRLMDEFIGIAGHELRTPLTTIKGSVQIAQVQLARVLQQKQSLPAEATTLLVAVQGHLVRSDRQIGMQSRLISDLLDVARVHANRLELVPELCDLQELVRSCVEDQQYLTPNRALFLHVTCEEKALVQADKDRVRQVIGNYLSNALKYSSEDKPVDIDLDCSATNVCVAVRDQGPGLSLEEQKHIWERFYRVPTIAVQSGSGVGLGLGLHISRMIIEGLGGEVGVKSLPGEGSTFWFRLPRASGQS